MKSNFFSTSSILKKFLAFNFIVFLVLGIFTFLYLTAIEPNLVKNRSNQHARIINNTADHINRLNIEFNKESATEFLLSTRFLFQNLDRVQLYDLNSNLLADTDTLDLARDIFVRSEGVQETSIGKSDENKNINESSNDIETGTFNTDDQATICDIDIVDSDSFKEGAGFDALVSDQVHEFIGNLVFHLKLKLFFFAINKQSFIICFNLDLINAGAVIPSRL